MRKLARFLGMRHNLEMGKATTVSRPLVGAIAAVLLIAAAVLWIGSDRRSEGAAQTWRSACTRIGIVMACFWLALPSRSRPAAWANVNVRLAAVGLVAVAAITKVPPRILLPLAIVTLGLILVLRPRPPRRPHRPADYRAS